MPLGEVKSIAFSQDGRPPRSVLRRLPSCTVQPSGTGMRIVPFCVSKTWPVGWVGLAVGAGVAVGADVGVADAVDVGVGVGSSDVALGVGDACDSLGAGGACGPHATRMAAAASSAVRAAVRAAGRELVCMALLLRSRATPPSVQTRSASS
ncbi:hypothetical protein GCM10009640_20220 [Agrococcus citreus]|uniref:Uncharacterized protein n=1 Tax=Agrococcus citreus TaxID=84643 RepID=A0ABP4JNN6_9MICO